MTPQIRRLAQALFVATILAWVYAAFLAIPSLGLCPPDEHEFRCARDWLGIVAAAVIGFVTLILFARQTMIMQAQTDLQIQQAAIAKTQSQLQQANELVARTTAIDNARYRLEFEIAALRTAVAEPNARSIVLNLTQLLASQEVMAFMPIDLGRELREHFERRLAIIDSRGEPPYVTAETESLMRRVYRAALEAQAGWETTYAGNSMLGASLPHLWRKKLADARAAGEVHAA